MATPSTASMRVHGRHWRDYPDMRPDGRGTVGSDENPSRAMFTSTTSTTGSSLDRYLLNRMAPSGHRQPLVSEG